MNMLRYCRFLVKFQHIYQQMIKLSNKRPTGLNGHLSIRDFTLNSFQKSAYLHINSPIIIIQLYRKAASLSFNTIAINVKYIDREEENTYSLKNDLYEFYNFGTTFLSHHYYTLSLFDLCLGVEKKIFKEIMQFHYMSYMATP